MNPSAPIFMDLLSRLRGDEAIALGLSLLDNGETDIPGLYETIIAPALKSVDIPRNAEGRMIWREHVMTGICRTLVEQCRPFVVREAAARTPVFGGRTAVLFAPSEEYHELGLRMGQDFFTLLGADPVLIGANLPLSNLADAVETLKPDLACISISNPLNLTVLDDYVLALRAASPKPLAVVLAGGVVGFYQPSKDPYARPDLILRSFADLERMGGISV